MILISRSPSRISSRISHGLVGLACVVLCSILTTPSALAKKKPAPAPKDRAAMEAVVHDYLLKNPGIVREALLALEVQEQKAKAMKARQALSKLREPLERDSRVPVGGNPDGDVTVVEFFDYRCPHCKRAATTVDQLIALDPKVRVVYKEFPILGPDSLLAARSALAAHKQGKYSDFHKALMAAEQTDEAVIDKLATELGLDLARFKADRDDAATSAVIDATYNLAGELEIGGTPAFIVGDRLIPGAAGLATLQELVAEQRKSK